MREYRTPTYCVFAVATFWMVFTSGLSLVVPAPVSAQPFMIEVRR